MMMNLQVSNPRGRGGILALPIMAYYGEIPPKRGSFSGLRYMKCSGRSRGETQGTQAPLSQGLDAPPPPLPYLEVWIRH